MSAELFVIEDDNGEMLDSDDDGGFSVFYTQEDAQRAIEDVGDDLKLSIVRFERSDKLPADDDPLATADLVKCGTFTPEARKRAPMIYVEKALFDRLLEDKERLDWLESHPFTAYRQRDPANDEMYDHFTLVDEDAGLRDGRRGIVKPTLRAAIDAALGRQA